MLKKYFSIFISFILLFVIFISSAKSSYSNDIYFPIHSNYTISSTYGNRYLSTNHFHNGIDIPKTAGTPIYPISTGVISYTGFSSSYGNHIIITYENGYKSLYGHTSGEYPFCNGSYVTPNDIVAYVGPKYLSNGKLNGFTTGPHLHFTVYKDGKHIDPLSITYK